MKKKIEFCKNESPVRMSGESYVIESVKPEDSGNYTCVATNNVGSRKSEKSTLQVHCEFHTPMSYIYVNL